MKKHGIKKKIKESDVFKKYQVIKKFVSSKALPIIIGVGIVFVICMFELIPGFTFSNLFKIDVVLSVGLVTIITWVISILEKIVNRRIEEKIKLNGNYEDHIKRYSKEKVFESNGKKYPLVETSPSIKSIKVEIEDVTKYDLDPIIVQYMGELMDAHKTSKFKNKPIYRVDELTGENDLDIKLSLSDQYKTLLTNRVMDFEIHDHITIREVFEPGPKLHSYANSKLCNGLGFNFIVRTSDGYYALVKQTSKNPTNKFKYSTCSSSLLTHFNDKDSEYIGRLRQLSYNALINNFNFPKPEKEDHTTYQCVLEKDIHYIGLVRNLIEGGKPELCYVLDLHITKDELIAQFKSANGKVKKDRGVNRIITFKTADYEIREHDKVWFKEINHTVTVPVIGMYILEKLKQEKNNSRR